MLTSLDCVAGLKCKIGWMITIEIKLMRQNLKHTEFTLFYFPYRLTFTDLGLYEDPIQQQGLYANSMELTLLNMLPPERLPFKLYFKLKSASSRCRKRDSDERTGSKVETSVTETQLNTFLLKKCLSEESLTQVLAQWVSQKAGRRCCCCCKVCHSLWKSMLLLMVWLVRANNSHNAADVSCYGDGRASYSQSIFGEIIEIFSCRMSRFMICQEKLVIHELISPECEVK